MNQERVFQVLLGPVVSEKAAIVGDLSNQYVFKVAGDATKLEVRKAVEQLFKVKVDDVRVMNVRGKRKRLGRFEGFRPSWKKAYVKLAPDQKMVEYFEGV